MAVFLAMPHSNLQKYAVTDIGYTYLVMLTMINLKFVLHDSLKILYPQLNRINNLFMITGRQSFGGSQSIEFDKGSNVTCSWRGRHTSRSFETRSGAPEGRTRPHFTLGFR